LVGLVVVMNLILQVELGGSAAGQNYPPGSWRSRGRFWRLQDLARSRNQVVKFSRVVEQIILVAMVVEVLVLSEDQGYTPVTPPGGLWWTMVEME
jgi:hypothetical protein